VQAQDAPSPDKNAVDNRIREPRTSAMTISSVTLSPESASMRRPTSSRFSPSVCAFMYACAAVT
jgi:hypothetical protein